MRARRQQGFQLLHLLVALTAAGILAVTAVPALFHWTASLRTRLAAGEVSTALYLTRSAAVRHGAYVGVKFRVDGDRYTYRLYRDGDGDGVRTADIEDGTDPPLGPPQLMRHLGAGVRFGFPPGPPPTDPGDPDSLLDDLDDPVRFNASDIASFSPLGESTPGSVYLTDSRLHLVVVRLYGRTAKIRTLVWDPAGRLWESGG